MFLIVKAYTHSKTNCTIFLVRFDH